jgi:hypothetical protein
VSVSPCRASSAESTAETLRWRARIVASRLEATS